MFRLTCFVGLVAVLVACVGCGGGRKQPASVAIKGTVLLDKTPLPDGEVTFLTPGEAATIFPVQKGAFSGTAFLGKNRVEIRSFKTAPRSPNALSTDDPNAKVNFIPDRYNGLSKLEVEVTAAGPNEFSFKVTSR